MRRSAEITLHGNVDLLTDIHEKIKNDAVKSKVVAIELQGFSDKLYIEIYEDTEGFRILMEEINKHNLFYTFAEGREYTKEEIKAAEFFAVEIIYPWESDGINAEEFGTQYERECNQCQCGKKQISELRIDKRKAKKYDIITIEPEIIVTERLRNLILEHNLTGCEFGPVADYKGRDELVLYQLKPTHIFPKMSSTIRVEVVENVRCKECHRNGMILRSEAIYERESLKDACDFNLSYEYFGINLYCKRLLIVSSKVYNLFQKNKIKRCGFEPVSII